jgi:hypothetical protein
MPTDLAGRTAFHPKHARPRKPGARNSQVRGLGRVPKCFARLRSKTRSPQVFSMPPKIPNCRCRWPTFRTRMMRMTLPKPPNGLRSPNVHQRARQGHRNQLCAGIMESEPLPLARNARNTASCAGSGAAWHPPTRHRSAQGQSTTESARIFSVWLASEA